MRPDCAPLLRAKAARLRGRSPPRLARARFAFRRARPSAPACPSGVGWRVHPRMRGGGLGRNTSRRPSPPPARRPRHPAVRARSGPVAGAPFRLRADCTAAFPAARVPRALWKQQMAEGRDLTPVSVRPCSRIGASVAACVRHGGALRILGANIDAVYIRRCVRRADSANRAFAVQNRTAVRRREAERAQAAQAATAADGTGCRPYRMRVLSLSLLT